MELSVNRFTFSMVLLFEYIMRVKRDSIGKEQRNKMFEKAFEVVVDPLQNCELKVFTCKKQNAGCVEVCTGTSIVLL